MGLFTENETIENLRAAWRRHKKLLEVKSAIQDVRASLSEIDKLLSIRPSKRPPKLGSLKLPEVFCEHCGTVETNTPQMEYDGIQWCVWCACAGDHITEAELDEYITLDD